jgi:hypothetical protein
MRSILVTGLLIWVLQPAAAQEMLGSSFSNYAGQMGVGFNPASIVGAPYRWELNLLSGDFAAQNNYMYLQANSNAIRKSMQGEAIPEDEFTDNFTTSDKWMYSSSFLKYPSFTWSGEKFAFAASVSTRAEVSATEIPYHLAKFMKEGFDYDPLQQTDWQATSGNAAMLNWHEFSVTGGMVLWDDGVNYWTGALTLNYNYGLNGLYLDINDFQYNSLADTLLVVYNLNADYGYALPEDQDNTNDFLKRKGAGFSGSFGLRYMHNRNENYFDPCKRKNDEKPYDFRIGFSLIDLGSISFNNQAATFSIVDESTLWYGIDTVKFSSIRNLDSTLGLQFAGNPEAFRAGNSMSVFTPTALTMDVDVPLNSWFFVNAAIVQRIPVGKYQVARMNQLSFTPRIEFRRFEFALPLSVYEYSKARLGAAFRIGAFTFGTDILSPLIGLTDAYGADFYFGISLKGLGECGRAKGGSGRKVRLEKCNTPGRN